MAGFERNENTMYSVPLRFADLKLKQCPVCGAEKPAWLVKEEWKVLGKLYHFKCPRCGSILQISQDDVTGLSYTTTTLAGMRKKRRGRELRRIYATVEKVGLSVRTPETAALEGAEETLEDLWAAFDARRKE